MYDLIVAGAGMAGLVAAAHARDLGANVLHLEKSRAPGGAMLLSSGVVWRHRELDDFRAECPDGDPQLQGLIHDRLDTDLEWLESKGAPVLARETGNPISHGWRFDTAGLTRALAGEIEFNSPLLELPDRPLVLATGGFAASEGLVQRWITREPVRLRSHHYSTGDGIALGLAAGGALSRGLDQFYGRVMPDREWGPEEFVSAAQLYARRAEIVGAGGDTFTAAAWHENDVVQWMAQQPGARATFAVAEPEGDTAERIQRSGVAVSAPDGRMVVPVVASITTTLGGLRGPHVAPGVWAAGQDIGDVATGGYSSGLAAALVLGRVAAERALHG